MANLLSPTKVKNVFPDVDLSGLPTSNPSGGKSWIHSTGALTVGNATIASTAASNTFTASQIIRVNNAYLALQDNAGTNYFTLHGTRSNILEHRNGASAQSYEIYNTYTNASNYERLVWKYTNSQWHLTTEKAGTGSSRNIAIASDSGFLIVKKTDNTYGTLNTGAANTNSFSLYTDTTVTIPVGSVVGDVAGNMNFQNNHTTGGINFTIPNGSSFGNIQFNTRGVYRMLIHYAGRIKFGINPSITHFAHVHFDNIADYDNLLMTGFSGQTSPFLRCKDSGGTDRFKLGVNGSLVWNPPSSITLSVNGDMTIEATSNTQATIKYRGSDGVTRTNVLTLS